MTECPDQFSDFLDGDGPSYGTGGQSLLTDTETQTISDFFTNTDPFHLNDLQPYPSLADTKHSADDFNNWSTFTPATVHHVTTTIPNQAHLQNGFYNNQYFAQPSLPMDHMGNTPDDIQAASTLFNNSQSSFTNGRSQSLHGAPPADDHTVNGASGSKSNAKPIVITQHGHLHEQLAALIPNHAQQGTLDAQLAAQWAGTDVDQIHEDTFRGLMRQPSLKRSYTFGTDDSFNSPVAYPTQNQEMGDPGAQRQMHELRHSQPVSRSKAAVNPTGSHSAGTLHPTPALREDLSEEEHTDDVSSDEGGDTKPVKRRRRSANAKGASHKPSRSGRNGKGSAAEESAKKKRASAAQKLQRENLTDAQKRSNHILSEQKRRNLIKRGFEDLHDIVPEIRTGGLSKSSVLMEAANFLEKLIQDNDLFTQRSGD